MDWQVSTETQAQQSTKHTYICILEFMCMFLHTKHTHTYVYMCTKIRTHTNIQTHENRHPTIHIRYYSSNATWGGEVKVTQKNTCQYWRASEQRHKPASVRSSRPHKHARTRTYMPTQAHTHTHTHTRTHTSSIHVLAPATDTQTHTHKHTHTYAGITEWRVCQHSCTYPHTKALWFSLLLGGPAMHSDIHRYQHTIEKYTRTHKYTCMDIHTHTQTGEIFHAVCAPGVSGT